MEFARREYVRKLASRKDNGRVKIVTGLRRSGKSYLLFELYARYLLASGIGEDQIVGLALDALPNARYRNPMELDKYVRERIVDKSKNYYIFIDMLTISRQK